METIDKSFIRAIEIANILDSYPLKTMLVSDVADLFQINKNKVYGLIQTGQLREKKLVITYGKFIAPV